MRTRTSRALWLAVAASLGGCADDTSASDDDGTTGEADTGTPTSTAPPTTTEDPTSSSGGPADGTTGGSTGPADDDDDTTGGEGTTGEVGSTGETAIDPGYDDCVNAGPGVCGDAACFVDDEDDPGAGVCTPGPCEDVLDCPGAVARGVGGGGSTSGGSSTTGAGSGPGASTGGGTGTGTGGTDSGGTDSGDDTGRETAAPACGDVHGDEDNECFLDCSGGATCPDAMACFGGLLCVHEVAPPGECVDVDLGYDLPAAANGSTPGMGDDYEPPCGGSGNAVDVALEWTAPFSDTYTFSLAGSDYDTILYLLDGCEGDPLACNDDVSPGEDFTSRVDIALDAGRTVTIIVDGWNDSGDYELVIDVLTSAGDCCVPHRDPGCEVTRVEECVCAIDNFCCIVEWDDICVESAVDDCAAFCLD